VRIAAVAYSRLAPTERGDCAIFAQDYGQAGAIGSSAENPYALEQEIPVFICRRAKFGTLGELWPRLKNWR
jgi:hypothetical protein